MAKRKSNTVSIVIPNGLEKVIRKEAEKQGRTFSNLCCHGLTKFFKYDPKTESS